MEYVPQEKMVIALYDISGVLIKGALSTLAVKPLGDNETELSFSSEVEPKGCIAKGFLGKRLESRLPKGAKSMLENLATQRRSGWLALNWPFAGVSSGRAFCPFRSEVAQ